MLKELENDIKSGNVNHAYFLECADEDIGLKEAKEFVESIFNCKINNNPDCIVFTTDEKSIKVESIRDLQKDISVKPLLNSKKIYIIPNANKMNISAQNCLLKTLEEPPQYAIIILIASSIYSVIGTIRSRVKRVKINTGRELNVRLEVKDMLDNISEKGIVNALKYSEFFEKNKGDIIEILHEMIAYCNERMMDIKNRLPGTIKHDTINIAKYVPIIDLTERRINENCNFSMTIDEMLLSFKE